MPATGIHFFKGFIYSFLERRREGEREGEQHLCARDTSINCLLHAPNWGPGSQPRYMPWLGITVATLWFTGQHSIHWATQASCRFTSWLLLSGLGQGISGNWVYVVPSSNLAEGNILSLSEKGHTHPNFSKSISYKEFSRAITTVKTTRAHNVMWQTEPMVGAGGAGSRNKLAWFSHTDIKYACCV